MEPRDVSCTPPPGGDFSEWRLVRRAAHEAAGGGLQYLSNLHFDAASATAAKESVGGGRSPHKNDGPARWARASNYPRPPPGQLLEERVQLVNPATRTTSFRLCRARSKPKTLALVDRHKVASLHNREWFTWSHSPAGALALGAFRAVRGAL